MKTWTLQCILTALLLVLPAAAHAQRVPATDSGALIGEVGWFFPNEDVLRWGPVIEGFYEYYFTPRNSVRFGLGWTEPKFDQDDEDGFRIIRVPVDLVYNWERGAVHPFAGAGLGIYFIQARDNGNSVGDSETKFGGSLFGGVEFFTGRTVALKLEGRYHAILNVGSYDPDGLSFTVGLKKYF
jgi:hypothetical protein